MGETIHNIKNKTSRLKNEVREKILGYLLAAFSLVAGLAWNDAIRSLIEAAFPVSRNSVLAKFIYAALLTGIIVFVSLYLVKILKNREEEKDHDGTGG